MKPKENHAGSRELMLPFSDKKRFFEDMGRFLIFLLLLASAAWAQTDSPCTNAALDQNTTLTSMLKAACISSEDIAQSQSKVDSPITSFAVLNTAYEFVIAYYERQENSDLLTPPLHLLRFIRKPKRWMEADPV